MKKQGFTTIEFLVVLAIIAILSAIVYSSFSKSKEQSRDQQRVSDISTIQLALETYYNQNHQYPTNISNFVPQYLPSFPAGPSGGPNGPGDSSRYGYNYVPITIFGSASTVCTTYHLWTTFEATNQYLQSKKGFSSSPLDSGLNYCNTADTLHVINASTTPLVYDITP
ncbi:MAG: type II secretion system protein [Candidatus Paceibacterota bacterium]|jgi:prepilin-type N-terminal cleavage/methylation domain-containing protein